MTEKINTKEREIRFERMQKFRPAQRTESKVVQLETLKNHSYRDWRDNKIMNSLTGRNLRNWEGMDVDEIRDFTRPKPATGYWKYCNDMAMKGGIPTTRLWDGIFTKDLDERLER